MVPVANRPALYHIVTAAARAGFSEVIVTTNYMAEVVRAYCATTLFEIPVRCVNEDRPMGTAGAVKNVEGEITGSFAVIQGDSFSEIDLAEFVAAHKRTGGIGTIAVMPVENPSEFGIVELDAEKRIVRFLEKPKPQECFSNLANTGFYIFERNVLQHIPADTPFDFSFELFPKLLQAGEQMYAWETQAYWVDLGRVGNYLAGNARFLSRQGGVSVAPDASVSADAVLHPPVLIGGAATVEAGCKIGPFCAIGNGARLGTGSRVERSILGERAIAAGHANLQECVIAEETQVGWSVSMGRLAIVGRGCTVGDRVKILEGSRVGPYVRVEQDSVVEGVISPNVQRIELSQALLTRNPAFAGLGQEELAICSILSEVGEVPAKILAGTAKVPFSRIHSLLFGLTQRGLVTGRGEAPKLFSLRYEDPGRIAQWAAQPR
jgi:mannose-1-phosphate guanylyltransferase/phosphomannomutase